MARIAGPGAIGAFLGATVLSSLSTEAAAPVMSALLALLGVYILIRFIIGIKPVFKKALTIKFLAPLGLVAGFVDATGGGGWGPVATPALLADGRLEPRKVIGTVDTSEFAVSAAASIGFLIGLGAAGINWGFALALLIGGLIAAPLAAVLVRFAPAHVLGVAVGGIILLTNSRTLLKTFEVETPARFAVYGAILLVTVIGPFDRHPADPGPQARRGRSRRPSKSPPPSETRVAFPRAGLTRPGRVDRELRAGDAAGSAPSRRTSPSRAGAATRPGSSSTVLEESMAKISCICRATSGLYTSMLIS